MRVLIIGPPVYRNAFEKVWDDAEFINAQHVLPQDLDWKTINLMVFTGGADVSPHMYGESPRSSTHSDYKRDLREKSLYQIAESHNIPKVGICRGSQFLNVMNGGKLLQHIHSHGNPHNIILSTRFSDIAKEIRVNSTHHQMMIRDEKESELFAYASGVAYAKGSIEPEVVFYPKSQSLCVQYHPELLGDDAPGMVYFKSLIKELF